MLVQTTDFKTRIKAITIVMKVAVMTLNPLIMKMTSATIIYHSSLGSAYLFLLTTAGTST